MKGLVKNTLYISSSVLFILFCLSNALSQNLPKVLILNNNVGHFIDSLEEAQYGFFPEYSEQGFRGAQFLKYPNGKVELLVYFTDKPMVKKELLPHEYKSLKKLLSDAGKTKEQLAEYEKRDSIEYKRRELRKHKREMVHAVIYDSGGKSYSGQILLANDTVVYFYSGTDIYNQTKPDSMVHLFLPSSVDSIHLYREANYWRSVMVIGLPVSAVAGVTIYGLVVAWFFDMEAYNFWLVMAGTTAVGGLLGLCKKVDEHFAINTNIETYHSVLPELTRYNYLLALPDYTKRYQLPNYKPPKFHVAYTIGHQFTNLYDDIKEQSYHSSIVNPDIDENIMINPGVNIRASYSINNKVWAGFAYHSKSSKYLRHANSDGNWTEEVGKYSYPEGIHRKTYSLFADYYIVETDRLMKKRFALSVGCGFLLSQMTCDYSYNHELDQRSETHDFIKPGIHLRASFDYYFSPNVSFTINLDKRNLPKIELPVIPGDFSYKLKYSSIDITYGFHFHF